MYSVRDPMFAPPSVLAQPPGSSAFRQKGNGYIGDMQYFDTCIRGGHKAVIAAIPVGPLRTYLEQPFRNSDWYDAYPCAIFHAVAARMRGLEYYEHRRQVGAYHANAAGGIYRALLKVVSNENIALWGPRVSSIFFEFGKTETQVTGAREVTAIRRGMPASLVQYVIAASLGFCEESLKLAGARSTQVELGEPVEEGSELWKVNIRIRWT